MPSASLPAVDSPAEGIITEIERYSIHDGPGIRSVVFFKGCALCCRWCCNPETFSPQIEMGYFKDQCLRCAHCVQDCPHAAVRIDEQGAVLTDRAICRQYCFGKAEIFPCTQRCYPQARRNLGMRVAVKDVLREVEKDHALYDRSGGGVTLTGGEISYQADFALELLNALQSHWIDAAIETNGYGSERFYRQAAPLLKFAFIDIKSLSDMDHRIWTGGANKQVLRNATLLAELGRAYGFRVVARIPVIPGFNDTDAAIEAIASFVALKMPGAVLELLPYHILGRGKYISLGEEYPLPELEPPTPERMAELEQIVRLAGVSTVRF